MSGNKHRSIEPAILYMGTPVVLVCTTNEDGSSNISPMSSAWWLGWSCMLGFDASSKTVENLLRTGECTLNLPSSSEVVNVDRLARTSGSSPLPSHKRLMGYESVGDKFSRAGLTAVKADKVSAPLIQECPIQLEAVLVRSDAFGVGDPRMLIPMFAMEVRIVKVHAREDILHQEYENRIDPDKWNPLLMSFLQFFDRGKNVHPSRLAQTPEEAWGGRSPKRKRAVAPEDVA